MGRMSRQRRYKSCDPFAIKKKENKFDNPPKKNEMKFDHFFKSKNFEKNQNIIDRAAGKYAKHQINDVLDDTPDKKVKKVAKTNPVKSSTAVKKDIPAMKPNETKKQYFQRLDESIQEAISKTMMETKTLRKKRKLHLKSRDEKIKHKKRKDNENGEIKDFSDFKDDIKFGEVAERPPSFSAIPRGATKDKKLSNLQLSSLFDKTTDVKSVKKRKEMTFVEQQRFDNERQKAIDAYRMIKKQKMKDFT